MNAKTAALIAQPETRIEVATINEQAKVIKRTSHIIRQFTSDLGKGVLLELVAISGGTFLMGSAEGSPYDDEYPRHTAIMPPFLMAKSLVTQEQWQAVMGANPYYRCKGATLPVENISWHAAREFCQRLAKLTRRAYHLPSESQWEYACRAGTVTPFYCGETITTDYANYCGEHTYRSEPRGVYRHKTTPAGSLPPNAFGLYDMSGNLWEYCADTWHDDYRGAPITGGVWEAGGDSAYRVGRGGSWHDPPGLCRSATRLKVETLTGDDLIGFRVVSQ